MDYTPNINTQGMRQPMGPVVHVEELIWCTPYESSYP